MGRRAFAAGGDHCDPVVVDADLRGLSRGFREARLASSPTTASGPSRTFRSRKWTSSAGGARWPPISTGCSLTTRAALGLMGKEGRVVLVSSTAGQRGEVISRRLRRHQGRADLAHQVALHRVRPGHHGQLRGARVGRYRHESHRVRARRRARADREHDPAAADSARRRYRGADPLSLQRPRAAHHRRSSQCERGQRPLWLNSRRRATRRQATGTESDRTASRRWWTSLERLEQAGFETWAVGGAIRDRFLGHRRPRKWTSPPRRHAGTGPAALQADRPRRDRPRHCRRAREVGPALRSHHVPARRADRRSARSRRVRCVARGGPGAARLHDQCPRLPPAHRKWKDHLRRSRRPRGRDHPRRGRPGRALPRGLSADPARAPFRGALRISHRARHLAGRGYRGARDLSGLSAERVREEWFKGLRTGAFGRRADPALARGRGGEGLAPRARAPVCSSAEPAVRDPVVLTAVLVREPGGRAAPPSRFERRDCAGPARSPAVPAAPGGRGALGARRWLAAIGPAADDLILAATLPRRRRAGSGFGMWPGFAREVNPPPRSELAVTGNDLIALGYAPGPALGATLDRLLEIVSGGSTAQREGQAAGAGPEVSAGSAPAGPGRGAGQPARRGGGGAARKLGPPVHRDHARLRRGLHARGGAGGRAARARLLAGRLDRDHHPCRLPRGAPRAPCRGPPFPFWRGDPPGRLGRRVERAGRPVDPLLLRRRRDRERIPEQRLARRAPVPRGDAAQAARGRHHCERGAGRRAARPPGGACGTRARLRHRARRGAHRGGRSRS